MRPDGGGRSALASSMFRARSSAKFRRVQTGKTNRDEAKTVVAQWQAAQSWDGQPKVVLEPAVKAFF